MGGEQKQRNKESGLHSHLGERWWCQHKMAEEEEERSGYMSQIFIDAGLEVSLEDLCGV